MSLKDSAAALADSLFTSALKQLQDCGTGITDILSGADGKTQISSVTNSLTNAISETVIPAVQGIGYAIALLFFIIAMVELISQERLTIEMFIKFFARIAIAVFAVSITDDVFKYSIQFGDALAATFANVFPSPENMSGTGSYQEAFRKSLDGGALGWIGFIAMAIVTIAPCYVVSIAVKGIVYVIAFTRLIEMCARGCLLPIAVSLISDDGWRGAGGRYIKKFIAICSQSAVLVIIGQISGYIIATVTNKITQSIAVTGTLSIQEAVGILIVIVGVCIAMVSVMFKSIGIVNDAFGA